MKKKAAPAEESGLFEMSDSRKPPEVGVDTPVLSTTRKPKGPQSTEGEKIAQLCGLIAGLPKHFDDATKALDEIKRRSEAAVAYGLLNDHRKHKMDVIGEEIKAMRNTITDLWKTVDSIIAAGITEPEQEVEL